MAGALTEFFWQGERLIGEWSPGRSRSYVYEPGSFRPLVMVDGEGPENVRPYYFQLDHLGTPQELTSAQGGICWSARYKAYGNVAKLDIEEIDNPLRFQGQYFDAETGLHYNRHRYYNPNTGRYLTADPIKLAGGLNSYRYVPNPTGWVDPLGLSCDCPDAQKNASQGPDTKPDSVEGPRATKAEPEPVDPYDSSVFGHAFERHWQNNTEFLKRRANAMNRPNGQWLDDSAAAEYISSVPGTGTVVVNLPPNAPARLVNPDGTFTTIHIATIVRKGNGKLITAFPGTN